MCANVREPGKQNGAVVDENPRVHTAVNVQVVHAGAEHVLLNNGALVLSFLCLHFGAAKARTGAME